VGVQGTGPFFPKLQLTPADTVAHMYFETYGAASCTGLSATIEIASTVQGPAIATSNAGPTPIEKSDGCILFGEFTVAALAPGDYALRIRLMQGGNVLAERVRSFRKTVR